MINRRTLALAVIVATIAAVFGGVTSHPAAAGTTRPGTNAAVPAAACSIKPGAYVGHRVCGMNYFQHIWDDGRHEYFIVGTNYAVFHAYQRFPGDRTWSKWISMGGRVDDSNNFGVHLYGLGGPGDWPTIVVLGTDRLAYCRSYTGSGWSGWHRC